MTLNKTQIEALDNLAQAQGWTFNKSFLHKSQIVFQVPGNCYAHLILREEKGKLKGELRNRSDRAILDQAIRIVNGN